MLPLFPPSSLSLLQGLISVPASHFYSFVFLCKSFPSEPLTGLILPSDTRLQHNTDILGASLICTAWVPWLWSHGNTASAQTVQPHLGHWMHLPEHTPC